MSYTRKSEKKFWATKMMQKPLCFGSDRHSNTSLICKRCGFEYKCYEASKRNNAENKKRIDAAVEQLAEHRL